MEGKKAGGEKPGILVMDVCDTLYFSNTTFDFICFFLRQHKAFGRLAILKILSSKISPVYYFLALFFRISHTDLLKKMAVSLLCGYTQSDLEKTAVLFAEQYLNSRKIRETHELLSNLRSGMAHTCLVSASLEPVVKAIAGKLNVDFIASSLNYNNYIFTGKLARDLSGEKLEAVQHKWRLAAYNLTVVTDNVADRVLVELAEKRYVVVHRQKNMKFWQALFPEFIKPTSA